MTHYGLRISEYRPGLRFVPWHRGRGCLGAAAPVTGAAEDEYNLNGVDCHASVTVARRSSISVSGGLGVPPVLYFVLCSVEGAVTLSSTGAENRFCRFKEMTPATSGVMARFPTILPIRNPVAGYGASAVTRTPDRGHVAEVKM